MGGSFFGRSVCQVSEYRMFCLKPGTTVSNPTR